MPDGQNEVLDIYHYVVNAGSPGRLDGPDYERPSYVLNDYKWGSPARGTSGGTITWAAITAGQAYPNESEYSSQATGIGSAFMATIRAAFSRWDDVANFSFVETTSPLTAGITLIFDELQSRSANTIGLAYTFATGAGMITNSYISFDLGRRYRLLDGTTQIVGSSPAGGTSDFYTLALHEIGHALGLDHEDDFDTVMSSFQDDVITDLTSDDIAGIRAIYGSTTTTPTPDDIPANSATTASVTVGGTAAGRVDSESDEDWFRVTLTAGASYRIDLRGYDSNGGTLLDPYLRLLDPSRAVVASDDDSGTGTDSQILYTVTTSGTYYIAASGFDGEQGTYTVAVATTATGDDYAASSSTLGAVSVGGTAIGRLETNTDADWFAVTLTSGQAYRIDVRGSPTNGGTLADPYVRVRSSAGVIYASDDDSGTGLDAQLTYTAAFTGVHYIEATAGGAGTGTYTVAVTATTAADDFTGTTSTTGVVIAGTPGAAVSGVIGTAGDTDWFRVSLAVGTAYRFQLTGGTLTNTTLHLRNSTGSLITSDDNGGNGEILYTATASGTYYLDVRAATSGATGTYTIAADYVALTDDYGATTATAGTMTVGTAATGSIALAADVDWLRVNLLGGMLYRFDGRGSASGGGTLADPVMSLLNSSGAAIISDNNSGPGEDARIFYTAPASGAYYIAMRSASSTATGTYTVNATASPDDYTATTATTGAVTPGSTATGVVETAGDRDWFRTTLTAGTAYDIEVRGTAAGSGVRWTQSSLMMRDAGGAVVTSDTRSGVGAAARLFFTPASSGTYYIDALAYGTGVGSYSVSVTPASALAAPAIMEETEEASGLTASAVAAVTAPPAFDLGDYMPQSAAPVGNLPLSPFAELLAVPDLPPEDRHRLEAADLIHRLQLQPSSNPFLLLPLG